MNGETEHGRQLRKMIERVAAFRLACKQFEVGAEEFEKFLNEQAERESQNGKT